MHVEMKKLPRCVIDAAALVGYRRSGIDIKECTEVCPQYWANDGSRGVYILVDLQSGQWETSNGSWGGPNMFSSPIVDSMDIPVPIPENHVVLKGSSGHVNLLTLYAPDDFTDQFNEEETEELTDNESVVLWSHKTLKSSARKEHYRRMKFTEAQLDIAKSGLVNKGLIKVNKNGASTITPKGRNAAQNLERVTLMGEIA